MLFSGVYVLWEDPLIVSCLVGAEEHSLKVKPPADILLHPAWVPTLRTLPAMFRFRRMAAESGKRAHFMRCSADADRLFRIAGLKGALVSISSYINERTFRIVPVPKRYDAIYPARMERYKRMYLAERIPSLFIQTYGEYVTADGSFDLPRFEPRVAHADFNRTRATLEELVQNYNAARVALALSRVEGAMLGSVEAMLCGIPLVSTPCRGGREQFFDDRYVRVADPNPVAIAAAVAELASKSLDPEMIRSGTLEKLTAHRNRLVDYVRELIRQRGARVPDPEQVRARLYGGSQGILDCYVHRRDFANRGWAA